MRLTCFIGFACVGLVCVGLVACGPAEVTERIPERCAVVGSFRACDGGWFDFDEPMPRPKRGSRCEYASERWRCLDRGLGSGPFECDQDACTQRHPRLPDVGEWECAEVDGVAICRGGWPAAGVSTGESDIGWRCGDRRGSDERICVDFAPDLPSDDVEQPRGPWRCFFSHDGAERRHCVLDTVPKVGGECNSVDDCPKAITCVDGRCMPALDSVSCWVDDDCEGTCRFGSCV